MSKVHYFVLSLSERLPQTNLKRSSLQKCVYILMFSHSHKFKNFGSLFCHYAQHDTQCTGKNEHHQVSFF